MASRKIELELTAKDTASKVIDKVGKSLDKVGESAESAAATIASELSAAADVLAKEVQGATTAADALALALGPELAAKTDVGALVVQFRQMGAEFDDIEANAHQLAAAIKKVDDVQLGRVRSEVGQIDDKMGQVRASTDQTSSVMSNFAGNAVQELPGVASALGPLGQSMGEFAEKAAEGNIAVSSLAAAIGPMVAATAGLKLVNHLMDQWKAANQAVDEQVKSLRDRILDGASAVEALNDEMTETREVAIPTLGLLGSGATDATGKLLKVGLTQARVTELVKGGQPAILAWAEAMREAGVSTSDVHAALLRLAVLQGNSTVAAREAAANNEFFGLTMEGLAERIADQQARIDFATGAVDRFGNRTDDAAGRVDGLAKVVDGGAAAMDDYTGAGRRATLEMVAAKVAAETAAGKLEKLEEAYRGLFAEISAESGLLDLKDSFDNVAQLGKEAFDAAAKGSKDAESKARDYEQALLALRTQLAQYAQSLDGLPTSLETQIVALLDEGSVDHVQAIFDALARTRKVLFQANALGVDSASGSGPNKVRAAGGATSGPTLVHKDEVMDLPPGTYVHPVGSVEAAAARRPTVIDASVSHHYYPTGIAPEEVEANRRRWRRRNGDT